MSAGPSGSAGTDYTREDADYDSTNEEDEETHRAKKARRDLADEPRTDKRSKAKVRSIPSTVLVEMLIFFCRGTNLYSGLRSQQRKGGGKGFNCQS